MKGIVTRYGLVRNATSRRQVEAYLPSGYAVEGESIEDKLTGEFRVEHPDGLTRNEKTVYVIGGRDEAGWTLDDYVIPRFASGLIWVEEIDLSHPVMKTIPV